MSEALESFRALSVFSLSVVLVFAIFVYFATKFFFRKCIISNYDPLNIYLMLVSCYCCFVLLPVYIAVGVYYYYSVLSVILFFTVYSLVGKVQRVGSCIIANPAFMRFFACVILAVVAADLIINSFFGYMPIFSEDAVNTRFLQGQNSRLLNWAYFALNGLSVVIFVFCRDEVTKKVAGLCLLLEITKMFLGGSKSSLIWFVMLICQCVFLVQIKSDVKTEYFLKRIFKISAISIAVVFPYFLVLINVSESMGDAMVGFFIRLVSGFDQLMMLSIVQDSSISCPDMGLLENYLSSFLKAIGMSVSHNGLLHCFLYYQYDFWGVDDVQGAGMLPNSNVILEGVVAFGVVGGVLFVCGVAAICAYVRKQCLESKSLKGYHIILFKFFVMAPFYFFLDGQRFVISFVFAILIYFFLLGLYYLLHRNAPIRML